MEKQVDALSSQRVFKKSSPNNKLTMYLSTRDLVVTEEGIDQLTGVLLVDPDYLGSRVVFGQVTLIFRYGREDEEVMGLKFCNEALMSLTQLYPPFPSIYNKTPLQEALLKRLGPNAYPFTMDVSPMAPPSVQLVPSKEYSGAPIGTSYDVRAYIADRSDEKLSRKTTVRMGIRVVQRMSQPPTLQQFNVNGSGNKNFTKKPARHMPKIAFFSRHSPATIDADDLTKNKNKSEVNDKTDEKATNNTEQQKPEVNDTAHSVQAAKDDGAKFESVEEIGTNKLGSRRTSCPQLGGSAQSTPLRTGSSAHSEHTCSDNELSQVEHIGTEAASTSEPAQAPTPLPAPRATVEKPFLLSDGRVLLEATLDRAVYAHGEPVNITVTIRNHSNKTVRRIKIFIVQHVDVCMFSNGKFKNVVAAINPKEDCPVNPGKTMKNMYSLIPTKGATKNWIALEDSYTKSATNLASTITCKSDSQEDRNAFAIYVSYYVKIKLFVSVMGGELALKLPFILKHTCPDYDSIETIVKPNLMADVQLDLTPAKKDDNDEKPEPEKDGT